MSYKIRNASYTLLIVISVFAITGWHNLSPKQTNQSGDLTAYIDPRIGNIAHLLTPTRPAMYLPNGMIRVYPMRKDYTDDQISSFPLINVSYGVGELFAIKPWTSNVDKDAWKARLTYERDQEEIHPWYYATSLSDDNIKVEFTPGKKTGFYRFTFPDGATQKLLLDAYDGRTNSWTFNGGNEISGMEMFNYDVLVYMYGEFSVAGTASISNGTQTIQIGSLKGVSVKSAITFSGNKTNTLEFRYAISYISVEQAKKNFTEEMTGKSFSDFVQNGKNVWNNTLSQITVEGGTEEQKRMFYTALYRCSERMVNVSEYPNVYYSAYNKKTNTGTRPFYTDDWAWDTYTALHPLRTILNPSMEEDMLQSYVDMYEQSGSMPTFPVIYGDVRGMVGFHTSILFLDAYRKGLRNIDMNKAFEGLRKNAVSATTLPWRKAPFTSLDIFYQKNGYMPALQPGEKETVPEVDGAEKRQSVSVTLANSYDDWAMSQLAGELGENNDVSFFTSRSHNYKNLWNDQQQFFMPKDASGHWIPINPAWDGGQGGRDYYTENNGWTYIWNVQEDIASLIKLLGGKQAMEDRLDAMFRQDIGVSKYTFFSRFPDATGLTGEFSMGNEPDFHIPYLYNYTGAAWKTQSRIRYLMNLWFTDKPDGMPGDDDGGAMSAFAVFSAMGFYPVTPGIPLYTIGSPLFQKVTISLLGDKKFIITSAKSSQVNKYIQSATLNGKTLTSPWFTHQQLMAGGILNLEMGPNPNKDWGKAGIDVLQNISYTH